MSMEIRSAIDFYERHPISSEIILAKLSASRGHLNDVAPEELFPHDQDHYGGLEANDTLAARAAIGKGTRVVDFCAGLGGPSRYLAHRYGADVTGIELTPARVKGAEELTRLVGLQNVVRVIEGNVMHVPLPDATVDVVVSQEALLHLPDKERTLAEAYRILKPGGRIAFTDWVAHRRSMLTHAPRFARTTSRVETSWVASLSARITSSREIIPTNWRSGPRTGKLRLSEAHHQLENPRQWRCRFDVNDGLGHHFGNRPSHQLIVVGHHLTSGEGKGAKKIEFGDDSQHLAIFHHGDGIEVVFLE